MPAGRLGERAGWRDDHETRRQARQGVYSKDVTILLIGRPHHKSFPWGTRIRKERGLYKHLTSLPHISVIGV